MSQVRRGGGIKMVAEDDCEACAANRSEDRERIKASAESVVERMFEGGTIPLCQEHARFVMASLAAKGDGYFAPDIPAPSRAEIRERGLAGVYMTTVPYEDGRCAACATPGGFNDKMQALVERLIVLIRERGPGQVNDHELYGCAKHIQALVVRMDNLNMIEGVGAAEPANLDRPGADN